MIEDFCKFFSDIEANPHALVEGLTIRDYLQARLHLQTCKKCHDSVERVVERDKKENKDEGNDGVYKVYTTLN